MALLVQLPEAKRHIRRTDTDDDPKIALTLEIASDIVYRHLKDQADAGWLDGSVDVPGAVQAATLLLFTHLYRHPGDDMGADVALWDALGRLLAGYRDPTVA